ncbi:hypothetical protein RJ640_006541 [Escallonia rubra]|uniref:SREBP regulating gene protein n=1 Tax=Escallonia rubra TaxID=112253 RepID=A0AA88QHS7_9ASTE|nr:hypothetical protein RJ640_006541 [Escallonia rubra]
MCNFRLNLHLVFSQLLILQLASIISAIRISKCVINCTFNLILTFIGHVCDALSLDPQSRCCPGKGEQYSCHGCNLFSQCCNSYEFCVSCCLSPAQTKKDLALKVKIAKPVTAGTYSSVFDYCAGRCRHNSQSVLVRVDKSVREALCYVSFGHHRFMKMLILVISIIVLPCHQIRQFRIFHATGATERPLETRLSGINIVIGKQGQSCDSACKSTGQSCVPSKLILLNQCEIMQKYMSCRGACLASIGADQPAEVVEDAPRYLNPGACLYTQTESVLSCDGSHLHTRRLCPCA